MKTQKEIIKAGQKISYHVPRIKPNIYVPVNAVSQGEDTYAEFTYPDPNNYEKVQNIPSVEYDQVDDKYIHGGVCMVQFSYKEVQILWANADHGIL